jgi:hypothetical protein
MEDPLGMRFGIACCDSFILLSRYGEDGVPFSDAFVIGIAGV